MQTLQNIRPGKTVTVLRVVGEGALKCRLMEMGLTCGTRVTVRKTAPFGDPIEVNVRGYSLSLRKQDAALVEVI
ncbi:MAG: ferrous iron transport protein A [Oscillospiraceae bacterium]|jgi:ferrous iron transport protein A|nr:ferrous iron transport protein A [Oscillospiraceae bacterium]